ncbi:MAG: hypothetical protein ACMUIG_01710 [Thermoplasmatota archaeon]
MKFRFGKPGRKRDYHLLHVWMRRLQSLLTAVLGLSAVFLFLTGVGEIGIYFLLDDGSTYVDWYRAPLILFAASLVCFILYLAVNYNRIKLLEPIISRLKRSPPPKEMDIPELD